MLKRWFPGPTPARAAGRKAGKAWRNILYHTYSDLEDLTGKDAYEHACDEARKWLASYRSIIAYRRSKTGFAVESVNEHEMFLEYVESFLKELAPELETRGQPKE